METGSRKADHDTSGGRRRVESFTSPSRLFREWDNETTIATYGALPFQLLSANFSPAR